ncbi:MAG: hypothetical protein Rhob2KO_51000 [Rhodopirellula baltica]
MARGNRGVCQNSSIVGRLRPTCFASGFNPCFLTAAFRWAEARAKVDDAKSQLAASVLHSVLLAKGFIIVAWGIAPGIENKGK